jgi:hypothetical protein
MKGAKAKGKNAKNNRRKAAQKAKYVFVPSSKRGAAYADYFNPDVAVERRMLGFTELVISFIATELLPSYSDPTLEGKLQIEQNTVRGQYRRKVRSTPCSNGSR